MPKKVKKSTEPDATDAGKSIATQLSDLHLENKAIKKLFHGQQAQINELSANLALMWNKIGM